MAIGASSVWRVRVAGNDLNGGGYDSTISGAGTDYSQQDAAQVSWSNLATSAANSTTVTSASATFTSAMVGNCINIASGTNAIAGFYFITAFTNTTTVTVDRTPATAGAMAAGVGKLGGAFASAMTYCDTGKAVGWRFVPGNTIYVRGSGLTNPTSTDYNYTTWTVNVPGDQTSGPITWISENGRACIGHCGLLWHASGANTYIGFKFIQTAATQFGYGVAGQGCPAIVFKDCVFDQNGIDATQASCAGGLVQDCEFTNTGDATAGTHTALANGLFGTYIIGCIFHKLKGPAVALSNADCFMNNLVLNNSGDAITTSGVARSDMFSSIMNNTIDGNTGHGIVLSTPGNNLTLVICNNIISNQTGVGKFGIYDATGTATANRALVQFIDYNFFYNNTTNVSTNLVVGAHSTTATDPQFVARATENMVLSGANATGIGFPTTFKNNYSGMTANTASYVDMGAVQKSTSGVKYLGIAKTATVLQASASNAAAATATGSSLNMTTYYGGYFSATITNGGTGPTIACSCILQTSHDAGTTWRDAYTFTAGTTASAVYTFAQDLPLGTYYIRTKFTGNTVQAVTIAAEVVSVTTL